MIKLASPKLDPANQAYLDKKQREVNQSGSYGDQVDAAKTKWKNKSDNHFGAIRNVLSGMTHIGRRCHYCEDSYADEVEHIKPKNLYPDEAFQWSNYLFSCGPCNGSHKNDQFAVFDAQGQFHDITRGDKDPVIPPIPGDPAFIDPRAEDPMDFLFLDLITFAFLPHADKGRDALKADFTINTLGLNTRTELVDMRKKAFRDFKARLKVYVQEKQAGRDISDLEKMHELFWREPHASVWREMVRSQPKIPELKKLFQQAPELMLPP
ncbi:MAG: aminoglycoside phosphotransferase [Magnetococcales bacterium]|nr:aminoglycoside phosphotransferase [Magnetococcales bacterium]